jgi:hypothetical protein
MRYQYKITIIMGISLLLSTWESLVSVKTRIGLRPEDLWHKSRKIGRVGLKVIDSHRRRHGECLDPRVTGPPKSRFLILNEDLTDLTDLTMKMLTISSWVPKGSRAPILEPWQLSKRKT